MTPFRSSYPDQEERQGEGDGGAERQGEGDGGATAMEQDDEDEDAMEDDVNIYQDGFELVLPSGNVLLSY